MKDLKNQSQPQASKPHHLHHHSHPSRRDLLKFGGVGALASLLAQLGVPAEAFAAQTARAIKRIYLAPDDHTDYFWTLNDTDYRAAFLTMLDYYLDLTDSTINLNTDFHSRWNCDGSLWLWEYEKNRPPAQFQRLINRIKDGHISAPLNALVVNLGGAPAEAVLRGMMYAGKLERQYNLRFTIAVSMENQVLPLGLASLWAGSGAKYSWKGICGCDTVVAGGIRTHEIYYAKGLDDSKVLMKWHSMTNGNESMGGYAEARNPTAVVNFVDTDAGFISRYPYEVIGAFGKGWDDAQTLTDEFVTTAQNMSNANRRVIVSNQEDFFKDFETTYAGQAGFPSETVSYGNDWDLYCAALAEGSASVKRSTEKLRIAEALASLVWLVNPSFMNGRAEARDLAWLDYGMFWEHNFSVSTRWEQFGAARVAWQRKLANEIKTYVDTLQNEAVAALGGLIRKESGTPTRFFVFNALSWSRTDIADYPYSDPNTVHVYDLTDNLEVPSQRVTVDGQARLRILAQNVPPVGYKVYEIRIGAGNCFPPGAQISNNNTVIENNFYRLTVSNRGAITSLIDKTRNNREFAATIGGLAINDFGAASGVGTLTVENGGAVSATIVATITSPFSRVARITLYRDVNRIDIRNDITQNFSNVRTWGFSFNLAQPDVWHEEVGAVIRAKHTNAGGHYASSMNRVDWLTLNHFADMSGTGSVGVTLSNTDCYFMKLGSSSSTTLDTSTAQINVLAGGRVGGDGTSGIFDQGGDSYFLQRFALQTHSAYNQQQAMQMSLEHQTPFVTGVITGGSTYPETAYSLVSLNATGVLLWALKPADDQNRLMARLWNMTGSSQSVNLSLAGFNITGAKNATHIETLLGAAGVANNALSDTINKHQIKTFALNVTPQAFAPVEAGALIPAPLPEDEPLPLPEPQANDTSGVCLPVA